jgi:hypothetical protein
MIIRKCKHCENPVLAVYTRGRRREVCDDPVCQRRVHSARWRELYWTRKVKNGKCKLHQVPGDLTEKIADKLGLMF